MNDKELWMMIRRALLMIVKAIEKRYPGKDELIEPSDTQSITFFDEDYP